MSSEKNKELFLGQVEQILEGVRQDRERVSGLVEIYISYVPC